MQDGARRPWTPDVELSREDAARLIAGQFRDLPSPRLDPLGRGWDNDAYLVDGRFVFRFPRRKIAAVCMRNEIASLPMIAGALPLPIPRPTHVGAPGGGYPYPFAGYPWMRGTTACSASLDHADRRKCAEPLGKFLAALHAIPVPSDAPEDPAGRKDVAKLVEKALAPLENLVGVVANVGAARDTIERLSATPDWRGIARWVHGDLYARHLLVDERKRLCGVIDWGDVHAGETADDLAIAYSFLPAGAREAFFEAYGEVDEVERDRARLYALHSGGVLASYGREVGDLQLFEAGRIALEFATG